MSYVAGVLLACTAMAIIVGMVYQALSYTHGRQIISRRQFILRMAMGALLLLTIALMFTAAVYQFATVQAAIVFWMVVTFLPVVVIILAWLDLRELRRRQHEQQAELYRNLAELQQELKRKPDQGE